MAPAVTDRRMPPSPGLERPEPATPDTGAADGSMPAGTLIGTSIAKAPDDAAPPGWLHGLAQRLPRPGRRTATLAVVAAIAVGCFLRFFTGSHLWLDEALTVEIARRPLGGLFAALRHDGAPPLYYLLLHLWIKLFGDGDVAVRALSGIISVATLPLAWFAGRRVANVAVQFGSVRTSDRRTGLAALLLFATSPYAIRYGSEARMYSLVVLLVLAFGLAIVRALEHPGRRTWAPVTLLTAAMAYTHYWTFLLLATVAVCLLVQARRRTSYRHPARSALGAMLAAGVLFLPWLPTFAFQMLHTGTPWAPKVHAQILLDTVFDWAGPTSSGALLGLVLLFAALIGFSARPSDHPDDKHLHVDLTGRAPGRHLAALWLVPLVLAYLVYVSGGSAYAERYTGISLPAFLLLAALGIGLLGRRKLTVGLLAVAVVSGLIGGSTLAREERSQAGQIAAKIAAQARPGDVVAYCPDQLGPAVHRALVRQHLTGVKEIALADPSGPALVDWVDYAARMQRANSADFARAVDRLAGPYGAIYFVRADGYRLLEDTCAATSDQLATVRERTFQLAREPLLEGATLERFSTVR